MGTFSSTFDLKARKSKRRIMFLPRQRFQVCGFFFSPSAPTPTPAYGSREDLFIGGAGRGAQNDQTCPGPARATPGEVQRLGGDAGAEEIGAQAAFAQQKGGESGSGVWGLYRTWYSSKVMSN